MNIAQNKKEKVNEPTVMNEEMETNENTGRNQKRKIEGTQKEKEEEEVKRDHEQKSVTMQGGDPTETRKTK